MSGSSPRSTHIYFSCFVVYTPAIRGLFEKESQVTVSDRPRTVIVNKGILPVPRLYTVLRKRFQNVFDANASRTEIVVLIETKIVNGSVEFEIYARNRDRPFEVFLHMSGNTVLLFEERWRKDIVNDLIGFNYVNQYGDFEDITLEVTLVSM